MPSDKQLTNLNDLRDAIDGVDQEIHRLLNQRARLAQQVADVKLAEVKAQTGKAEL